MFDIYTARVPIIYTEVIEREGVQLSRAIVVGQLFTTNLLASMKEIKEITEELKKR